MLFEHINTDRFFNQRIAFSPKILTNLSAYLKNLKICIDMSNIKYLEKLKILTLIKNQKFKELTMNLGAYKSNQHCDTCNLTSTLI